MALFQNVIDNHGVMLYSICYSCDVYSCVCVCLHIPLLLKCEGYMFCFRIWESRKHSSLNFALHWTCTRQLTELPALYFVSQSQTARFRQFKLRVQMIWGLRFQTNSTFLIVKVLFVMVKCKKEKFSRNMKSLIIFAMFVEIEILTLIEMRRYQGRGRGG